MSTHNHTGRSPVDTEDAVEQVENSTKNNLFKLKTTFKEIPAIRVDKDLKICNRRLRKKNFTLMRSVQDLTSTKNLLESRKDEWLL